MKINLNKETKFNRDKVDLFSDCLIIIQLISLMFIRIDDNVIRIYMKIVISVMMIIKKASMDRLFRTRI